MKLARRRDDDASVAAAQIAHALARLQTAQLQHALHNGLRRRIDGRKPLGIRIARDREKQCQYRKKEIHAEPGPRKASGVPWKLITNSDEPHEFFVTRAQNFQLAFRYPQAFNTA